MKKISNSTQNIIEKLGYVNSENMYYFVELDKCKELSFHDRKVLQEIEPSAFFVVDGKPKVLFFDFWDKIFDQQKLHRKIWNAQVPIVIFCDFDSIKVFNGNSIDLTDIDNLQLNLVAEESISNCNEMSPFSYWNITNEKFLRDYQSYFSKDTLNDVMIKNIKCITDKLKNEYHVDFATKLILRIIFIRFLIDRGVNIGYEKFCGNVESDQKLLLKTAVKKESLYRFFEYLKEKFNGNLFELGNEENNPSLTQEVFRLLESFLSGMEEMDSGQLSFLPLYDFNIIPIELISNIYEILLGEEAQQNDKAFYTPSFLADYIVKESVGTYFATKLQCRVLDPACGSGIFLVQTLKQIISKNVDANGYIDDNEKLVQLIEENIYGVDLNPDAIDITIFSLYLTLLDYKDPKSLEGFKLPNLENKNLFACDFFDDEKLCELRKINFDFILGNPPWGTVKTGMHLNYCENSDISQQRQEISRSFIAKVQEYSNKDTICVLIVPSKLFYNQQIPAVNFRKNLLKTSRILKIIEMSSVRKLIFKKANAPAAVLFFQYSNENCLSHNMIHISLKPNMFFKLYHIIATEKIDIKKLKQSILYENDWVWKVCVYGTSWDIDIIRMLKRKFKSLKTVFKDNNLKTAAGISDNVGKFDASCYRNRSIIESTAIDSFFYDPSQKSDFEKENIHRIGKTELYKPPYCLMRKGANCENYRLRAAYVDDDVIFKQAISAIKGNENQNKLLCNIVGLINSSLYAYLNLMLGSSMGIEREQVFMNEIYQYPFIDDEKIGMLAKSIQDKNSTLSNGFKQDIYLELEQLDKLVLKDFGLDNDPFIDYALNVQVPMLNSSKMEYRAVNIEEFMKYADIFDKYWGPLMEKQNKFVSIVLYPKVINKFAIFELKIIDEKPDKELIIENYIDSNKEILSRFMISKINEQFYQIRDIMYFENNSFYIIKSNEYKNWHVAMANMDNTAVVDSILSNGKGE